MGFHLHPLRARAAACASGRRYTPGGVLMRQRSLLATRQQLPYKRVFEPYRDCDGDRPSGSAAQPNHLRSIANAQPNIIGWVYPKRHAPLVLLLTEQQRLVLNLSGMAANLLLLAGLVLLLPAWLAVGALDPVGRGRLACQRRSGGNVSEERPYGGIRHLRACPTLDGRADQGRGEKELRGIPAGKRHVKRRLP